MKTRWLSIFVVAFPVMAAAGPITSKQGDAILEELRQIRQLLERQQARPPTGFPPGLAKPMLDRPQGRPMANPAGQMLEQAGKVRIENLPILGKADAPLALVMFTDYECPFCRRFETQIFPEIYKQYIATGKAKFAVMDAPLDSHANARKAAEAARCAADQNRFWEYRGKLVLSEQFDGAKLLSLATESGLDAAEFEKCLASGKHSRAVADSVAEAGRLGVTGTPTFFIGREKAGSVEGMRVMGAQPFTVFEQKFGELLEKKTD